MGLRTIGWGFSKTDGVLVKLVESQWGGFSMGVLQGVANASPLGKDMLNFLVLCVIEMLIQMEFTVQIVFSGYTINVMALPNRNIKYFLKNKMITHLLVLSLVSI